MHRHRNVICVETEALKLCQPEKEKKKFYLLRIIYSAN